MMRALLPIALLLRFVFALNGVPPSNSTVRVSRFNVHNLIGIDVTKRVWAPVLPGHESYVFPVYSFLVEHGPRKLLFDIGIRKDPENSPPVLAADFTDGTFYVEPQRDITDVLNEAGIPLSSIEGVVWSHSHFDHIAHMGRFPNSTALIVGAETDISTFPYNPNSALHESYFAGRHVHKIDFALSKLKFNDLKAVDYFGDGSFYLVDAPGHLPGHLTALARVTPSPKATFILLGGDSFHHPGEARPRPALQKSFPCPGHLLDSAAAHVSTAHFFSPGSHDGPHGFDLRTRAAPLLSIATGPTSYTLDPDTAEVTLEKIARWDADEDVLVLIAHDASVVGNVTRRGGLPYHPLALNEWKSGGWKEQAVWNFLDVKGPAWIFS
ncbi:Metallo-beta-lactamase superfamily protein [Mycena kentingensis (nom. inval.)]|nr:Metallo-beta-lactamase superfamily protein [Mycena kentingensis (nom. inval.)]